MIENCILVTGACVNTGVAIVEKFARGGWSVVFTGRDGKKVAASENEYRKKFPDVWIKGYVLDSLLSDTEVDAASVKKLFGLLDGMGVFGPRRCAERRRPGTQYENF